MFSKDLFPQAWAAHARFEHVGLRVQAEAELLVKVFRHLKGATPELILELPSVQGEMVLALPPLTECGDRLSYNLYEGNREIPLQPQSIVVDWVCDRPPERQVGIAVVVCTRDRDPQLQMLVGQIAPQMGDVESCIIVNQGKVALKDRLVLEGDQKKYRIFEQDNLGGAGGFTRGIMEALKDQNVTHVLLMDDDVEVDAGLFCRLRSALSYVVSPKTCLGGAMINLDQRDRLLSVGHGFDPIKAITTDFLPRKGVRLGETEARSFLERPLDVDFCGWWFFCFPRQAVEVNGLPLPLFLRGDDAEYGLRLKRAGFPTVMWPGIYVAHPHLLNQTRPWHQYYDRRNALVCAALQCGFVPSPAIIRLVRGVFNAIALYRYAEARAGIRALQAYLDGAEGLERWSEEGHRALVEDDEVTCQSLGQERVFLKTFDTPLSRTIITVLRVLGDILAQRNAITTQAVKVDATCWKVGTIHRPVSVWLVGERQIIHIWRDAAQARDIALSLLRLMFFLATRRSRKPETLLRLSAPRWWAKRLGVSID
ncbi:MULTISPECIES: glycosyltransferase family 2 protein [unclassified Gluconobacter]|uniref:glycosyltransferase family 2 protein n=1 Tax=unclassified Gluconobacter TaxID=2644261 RepID=UPI001758D060|nr:MULTISPECIES: glycosyltransferase family 2 protein [unclassified Gluconobacter]GFE97691.1 hypothetical protein DmGdi_27640 [Gluconobacter sp. Gdi]